MSLLSLYLGKQPFIPPVGVLRVVRHDDAQQQQNRRGSNNAEKRAANIAAARTVLADGPAIATEIAAEIGIATPTVRRVLEEMIDLGEVTKSTNSAGISVFQLADQGSKK